MTIICNFFVSTGILGSSNQRQAEVHEILQWEKNKVTEEKEKEEETSKGKPTPKKHHPKAPSFIATGIEDEAAITRHLKFLQTKQRKTHPNKQVTSLMLFNSYTHV